jgi:GTP cyclohydrolase III
MKITNKLEKQIEARNQNHVRPSWLVMYETNAENGATPSDALREATRRLEAVAYAQGMELVLSRLEMLAAIIPSSITKSQLIAQIKLQVSICIEEWNAARVTQTG